MKTIKALLLIGMAIRTCMAVEPEHPQRVALAYVTSWSNVIPDPAYVTHINYAFGHVNNSFNGVRIDNEERLKTIVALKKQKPSLKVMLSIGGWGSGRFSEMAAAAAFRKDFAADCRKVVRKFALDGIDIDWEFPTSDMAKISASPDDTENFTLLMKDIRKAIGDDKLLTLASNASAKYIDFKAVNPYVDFVNIMTYDMASPPKHHSALYRSELTGWSCGEESVNAHIEAGIPPEKLTLGIPFYGHGRSGIANFIDYKDIINLKGYTDKWDDTAKVPYLTNASGEYVCTYENVRSIGIKCRYLLDRKMLGAMYWDYDGDDPDGTLRKAVYNGVMTDARAQTKIRTMIATGQDGSHWWEGGSDAVKQILENTGLFTVDIIKTPAWGGDMTQFDPDFSKYDLVVINYGGATWVEEVRKKFEAFVAGGGGVVAIHSSMVPMADWPEYNRMIGLAAWERRDEKCGPYVYWADGKFVRDYSPGWAGHHALQRQSTIEHRNTEHPITKGLNPVWKHFKDEIYSKLRGPAQNIEILATTYDDVKDGGSGRHEPMLWTVGYGKGKVFVTLLGHAGNDPELRYSMECTGFQVTLSRGAEWAATGVVTQNAPDDFPTEHVYTLRPEFKPAATK